MYDLVNIFDVFLPQLLSYPNPSDPLNAEAAGMMIKDPERFKKKVKDYIERYAKEEHIKFKSQDEEEENDAASLSSASEGDEDDLAEFEL